MKKSWHPVLLVNQERVWKAEKAAVSVFFAFSHDPSSGNATSLTNRMRRKRRWLSCERSERRSVSWPNCSACRKHPPVGNGSRSSIGCTPPLGMREGLSVARGSARR